MPEIWHLVLTLVDAGARILTPVPKRDAMKDPSKRERQLLEALYRLGSATAAEIHAAIPNAPSYTAVRTHLGNLEEKGLVRFHTEGTRYVYEPVVPREDMGRAAVGEVLRTFFENRVDLLVATLMSHRETGLTADELASLTELIDRTNKESS